MGANEKSIIIRPTTSVYATYRRLSYKPWFALAEFVDNSTQSYFQHRDEMKWAFIREGVKSLAIEINYCPSDNTLTIYDNAYGMELDDFARALVLDRPPLNRQGRSEFGMGLKTAACWFGSEWTVKTTQLGSSRCFSATIDVDNLACTHSEEVNYEETQVDANTHFTCITIRNLHQPIRGRTVARVMEQLSSIYREDIRSKEVVIKWNGDPLSFEDPAFFEEMDSKGIIKEWKAPLKFDVPWEAGNSVLHAHGWIGIRRQGKQSDAGLVLLRRGRVIIGGPGEGYKPVEVFGQGNTFRSQRLIGELHMDNWPVTQAKDGFDWSNGLEEAFIEKLVVECKEYSDKAEIVRFNDFKPVTKKEMETASEPTKQVFTNDLFVKWVKEEVQQNTQNAECETLLQNIEDNIIQTNKIEDGQAENQDIESDTEKLKEISEGPIQYVLNFEQGQWIFRLYWQNEVNSLSWMGVKYRSNEEIDIFLNTKHPFFAPYINDRGTLEMIQKFIIAMALAEKMARMTSSNPDSLVDASEIRVHMNKILRKTSEIEEVSYNGQDCKH